MTQPFSVESRLSRVRVRLSAQSSPEEIPTHLPHLALAQVFDALSYFADHQNEILNHIEQNRIPDGRIDPRVKDL